MGGLRNKSAKLQSEIEHYEIHEEMIERSLKDIKTGGERFFFNWMKFSALPSCIFVCFKDNKKKTFLLCHSDERNHP